MKKTEAYKGVVSRLNQAFDERGFEQKGNKYSAFFKKTPYGYQRFFIEVLDYNPLQKIEFGGAVSHNSIETIIEHVCTKFNLNYFAGTKDTIVWSYPYSLGNSVNKCSVKEEKDFDKCIDFIKNHLDKYVFQFYDQFSDLNKIDKVINGVDFWKTDWQMPYGLAGLFEFKRTIIAYLCSNPRLDEIKEHHIKTLNTVPDCEQLLLAYDYLFVYLQDVKPLIVSAHE
ncbi:MAG: hypothetical protein ACTHJT_06810 [Cytophaga sp.]|uniref:hypothetical protein n=1 Tax=Cytophaga sp. TaxID=29535 RepID=UPI003F808FCD